MAHKRLRFGFDHDAREGFGAAVAYDDSARVGQLLLSGADSRNHRGDGFEGLLLANLDVDDDLRKDLEVSDQFGERLAAAMDGVEHKKRGEQAVARSAAAIEDNVAGLLATKRGTGGEHLLEDVLVADGGAQHLDTAAFERGFEAHIGHGSSNNRVIGQQTPQLQ